MAVIATGQIRAHGIDATVRQAGLVEATEGVLFLHGNPGSSADWLDPLSRVGDFGRAVALDMPGFGRTRTFAGFDHRVEGDYRGFLDGAVDALALQRVHLVVHDFGGPWGLAWAARHPEQVASLTLVNTGALPGYRWHRYARMWQTPVLGELVQAVTNRSGQRWLLGRSNPRLPVEFIDRMYDDYDSHTRATVLALYRAARDPDQMLIESVFTLPTDIPTLVIWGAADPWVPVDYAPAQRDIWPRAEIVTLDGLGHWPFADDPDAFAAALVPFLHTQIWG
jgi:pimeloyl-ACP methyl ester carboxylesterase